MRRWQATVALVVGLGMLAGCGGEDEQPPPAACTEVDGVCVGVPFEPLCGQATCTEGMGCAAVHEVASDAELDAAIASAGSGQCIALAPGSYHGVAVPAGVSLLGRSAAEVKIGALTLADGAQLRGLEAQGGIVIGSATGVAIDAVRVQGGADGLACGPGASLTVTRSEIIASTSRGLVARDAASITVERSIVRGAGSGGLWVQCDAGCDCAAKPDVSLDHVLFENNHYVSVAFRGARARLVHVHVLDTSRRESDFALGGALSATHCSDLSYAKLYLRGGSAEVDPQELGFGALIDGSSAAPVGTGVDEKGIIIINGKPGIWIQATGTPLQEPTQSVVLDGLDVQGSPTAGIGFDLEAKGIIIINGKVDATRAHNGPTQHSLMDGNVETVVIGQASLGIGMVWKAESAASIEGLELSGSATHSVVIDGAVGSGSALNDVTLSGGDEQKGIMQQFVQGGGAAPVSGANVPALQQFSESVTDVPLDLAAPGALQ